MADDLAHQIQALQRLRSLLGEETYQAQVHKLRQQYGDAAVDTLLAAPAAEEAARDHRLSVGHNARLAVAVAGDVHGSIYIAGRRDKTAAELLAGYLVRLTQRCGSLPLQGIYEQRAAADSLDIELDRVYTQLATTASAERERMAGAALAQFDAAAFLAQHTSAALLPAQRRIGVRISRLDGGPDLAQARAAGPAAIGIGGLLDLERMDADDLARAAQEAEALTFVGPQLVSEAIAANERLALLGEPGSGKSTALSYLALTLAAGLDQSFDPAARLDGWSLGRLLPVFASLLPLAKHFAADPGRAGDADNLWNYLADHLEPKGANAGLAAAVNEEIAAGRVILLLDGLDEVAGAESRHKVVRAVRSFANRYQDCRIVVACRVRAYEGERNRAWQLPGWPTATLADWTVGQMTAFVRAWYHVVAELRGRSADWRDERIAGLSRAIEQREDLQRFGRQPLMMTIMALVHLNDGRLPEERASLYGRCLDILLGQWEVTGREASEYGTLMDYIGLPDVDVQSLRPLLGRAAYEAHRAAALGAVGRLSRPVLRTMVDDELKRRGHPNPSQGADRFLEYADLRAGLIQASDAGDDYVFPHQTFQEYLAGLELVGGVDPVARILALRSDDRWRRPILLGIEQLALSSLAVPYHLLSRLVEEPGRDAPQRAFDLLLAAEVADDIGWAWLEQRDPLFRGLRRSLAAALAETLGEAAVPARERVQAGVALGVLGDPRAGVCDLPPAMVRIDGGKVEIGDGGERSRLTFATFEIGRYPVTNAQYALFMADNGYKPAQPWWDDAGRKWLTGQRRRQPEFWDDDRFGKNHANHPVVSVTWYEATAFCRWLSQHPKYNPKGYTYTLPSDAEWEYAARVVNRRPYPWGPEEPDAERANFDERYHGTTAVGCFPRGATPEGLLDLAGNVWEWTRSEYRPYPYDPADGREDGTDPAQKRFTIRGGGWVNRSIVLRTSSRDLNPPDYRVNDVGFRLARHPPV